MMKITSNGGKDLQYAFEMLETVSWITESQKCWGCKPPLEAIWSKPLVQAYSPESQLYWLHNKNHGQKVKGCDSPPSILSL